MVARLNTSDADFQQAFSAFLSTKRESSPDVNATVEKILNDVRARGDAAVLELTEKFDRPEGFSLKTYLEQNGMRSSTVEVTLWFSSRAYVLARTNIPAKIISETESDDGVSFIPVRQ